jgi:hypothetical protein
LTVVAGIEVDEMVDLVVDEELGLEHAEVPHAPAESDQPPEHFGLDRSVLEADPDAEEPGPLEQLPGSPCPDQRTVAIHKA